MDNLLEPPTTSVRPYHPHHCHDLALQKYLLLYEQHESLRQHLDELRPTVASQNSICTPVSPSPAVSPTTRSSISRSPDDRSANDSSPQHAFSLPVQRSGSCPDSNSIFRHYHHHQPNHNINHNNSSSNNDVALSPAELLAVEEAKLCGVNEGMKRALTELLNCEAVRGDHAFRTWVQCRLMDTERELRSGRRRRSAPGS
ncbi:hypothetical protein VTG60DRAFT_1361 [Thermothelomyces hinnuleus]